MDFKDLIQYAEPIITILGVIFIVYKTFRDPDISADKEISLIKQACGLKHGGLDKDINDINKTLSLIQENELRHYEARITGIEKKVDKIFTILEERLPPRK